MRTTDPLDLDRLVELAEAATPGPWFRQGTLINGPDQGGLDIGPLLMDLYSERDAAYIAAISPSTVLALVRELRDVKRRRWHHSPDAPPEHFCEDCDALIKELREARDTLGTIGDRLETVFNLMHPGELTDDERHGMAQGVWFAMEDVRTALRDKP